MRFEVVAIADGLPSNSNRSLALSGNKSTWHSTDKASSPSPHFRALSGLEVASAPGHLGLFRLLLPFEPQRAPSIALATKNRCWLGWLFRLLYYLIPFAIALAILGAREIWLNMRGTRSKPEFEPAVTAPIRSELDRDAT